MLTPCEELRLRYEPGQEDEHLADCASCAAWVAQLESASDALREAPALPEGLRRSLLALPLEAGHCPSADDLVPVALDRGAAHPSIERHLEECAGCRAVAETLADGVVLRGRVLLPPALRERLLAIAKPVQHIPAWLRWGDVGSMAASFVLTAFLTLVAGDSAASLFREAPPAPRVDWIGRGLDGFQEGWDVVYDGMETRWSAWAARVDDFSSQLSDRLGEADLPFSIPGSGIAMPDAPDPSSVPAVTSGPDVETP